NVVGPDMKPIDLKIHQTAPGRYVGEFDSPEAGSYFLMLSPGGGMAPILSGVDVPYSPGYFERDAYEGMMKALSSLQTKGPNEPGQIIEDTKGKGQEALLAFDPYRHNLVKASNSQDIWHLLMLTAACLFFADVFLRRVQVSFAWVPPLANRALDKILRRESKPAPVEMIERLRSRKAAISQQIEAHRAAARFEPSPDAPAPPAGTLDPVIPKPGDSPKAGAGQQPGQSAAPDAPKEDDDYT